MLEQYIEDYEGRGQTESVDDRQDEEGQEVTLTIRAGGG
jgi:hypothetical protein